MILGIGTDIARIERFAAASERHGARFAARILGQNERTALDSAAQPAAWLAKRFAAKEAFLKALGTGLRYGMSWGEIEVINDHLGCPRLVLSGVAAQLAAERGVARSHLSLSDESDVAVAFVVLEGD